MSFQFLTLIACAAGMALVGLVYNALAVHFMVGALVGTLLVSYVSSRLSARSLSWTREAADRVFELEPLQVAAELENRGRLPRFLLTVSDRLPDYMRSDQPLEFVLPALWPGEKVRLAYEAYATKRGVYQTGPLRVSVSDLFGVFQRTSTSQATGEVVVYPRPVPLADLEVSDSVSDPAQVGGERSQASESGLEFYGVRDYQPGDELRRIHWPATAHHNQLTVIEFERGASRSLTVILDAAAGTEFGAGAVTTFELGIRIAASLLHWALVHHGSASLAFASADGPAWVELDRLDQEYLALEHLARLKADGRLPVSQLLEWAGARVPTGGAACVITCAPDPALAGAIQALGTQRIRVSAALIDPISFDPKAPRFATATELDAAGSAVAVVRRGQRLQDALSGPLLLDRWRLADR